jgi:3',5'-cyclic AMP phosphodiesterase CpdA
VVSPSQLERFAELSRDPSLDTSDAARVALVHHNLHPRGWRKDKMHGLWNREALLDALREHGVPLLLHGHTHVAHRATLRGVEVVGCGSTTWSSPNPRHLGRYNVYTFGRASADAPPGLVDTEVRHFDPDRRAFGPREG